MFGKDFIPVRIFETDGEIDSLFNGYSLDPSSDEEEEDATEIDDNSSAEPLVVGNNKGETGEYIPSGVLTDTIREVGPTSSHVHKVNDKIQSIISDPIDTHLAFWSVSQGIHPMILGRCNMRILSNQCNDSCSVSNEADNTINVGNKIGFNMDGVEEAHKRSWVKRVCLEQKVNFLGLQETMTSKFCNFDIQSMWHNSCFDYVYKKSEGKFGGIVAIWDTNFFSLSTRLEGDGNLTLLGDFNEVRNESERKGPIFDPRDFTPTVVECWTTMNLVPSNPANVFKSKLQQLKASLKQWRKNVVEKENLVSMNLLNKIDELDMKAETSFLSSVEVESRITLVKSLADIEYAKVKCNTPKLGRSGIRVMECYFIDQ
ncbi:cytochrome P450 [Tanacetum coccineum]